YPTTQNNGPLAWGDVAIYNTFPLNFPVDFWSFQLDGRLYIAETGTYRFGINAGNAADILIDAEYVIKNYGSNEPRNQGATEFNTQGTATLTAGTHPFIARVLIDRGSAKHYGIVVSWRKELNSNEKGTGSQ